MSSLCYPSYEALCAIERLDSHIIEIGAGDGEWARAMRLFGIHVTAYDLHHNEHVRAGSHKLAALHDGVMMAVWPADDNGEVREWIAARKWQGVIIVGDWMRFDVEDLLAEYGQVGRSMILPPGSKGVSEMRIYMARATE